LNNVLLKLSMKATNILGYNTEENVGQIICLDHKVKLTRKSATCHVVEITLHIVEQDIEILYTMSKILEE
jgi:hypothetical protein